MGHVFVSYSSIDIKKADAVRSVFNINGIKTWMAPYDVPSGCRYAEAITDAIEHSDCFCLLLSKASQESDQVDSEVNLAKGEKIPFIIVQIEDVAINKAFKYYIANKHIEKILDVNSDSPEMQKIIDAVRKHTDTPKTAKPTVSAAPKAPFRDTFISEELEAKVRTANENSRRLKEKLKLIEERDKDIKQKLVQFDVLSAEFDKKLQNFRLRDSLISKTPAETINYDNGDVWSGNYDANGRKTGICTYKWTSGGEYHGDYLDGKRTGFGIQKWASGTVYEGEYLDACLDGIGRNTWNDGDVYLGLYKNDKRNGFGKYVWLSGSVYIGDYTENKRTGLGIETLADGTEYRGEFLDGEEEGLGKTSTKERVYTGDFKNGKKTGLGIFEWSNGDSLEGEYENNFLNGVGIYKWKSGTVYIGDYVKGKRTGLGRYIWSNGSRHDGHFEDGKRIGKGTYFLNDRIIDGIWKDDRIFEATEFDLEGNVVAEYKNGTRYPK